MRVSMPGCALSASFDSVEFAKRGFVVYHGIPVGNAIAGCFAIGTVYLPEDLLQIWLYPVFMIDTDGWESIEPTSPEVFAKYRHDNVVLCIRRGDDLSDDIVVEVIDDGTRRDISRRELMPDALRVARSFMESVTK